MVVRQLLQIIMGLQLDTSPVSVFRYLTGSLIAIVGFEEGQLRVVGGSGFRRHEISQKTAARIRCQAGADHVTLKYLKVMLISMLLVTTQKTSLFERPSTNVD